MTRTTLGATLALLVAAMGVARLQPRLASVVHEVKEGPDVFALPPPAQLRVAVLGWNAAAVDLLWANLLVEYGMHFQERRDFLDIPLHIDSILALEPTYAPLYKYVDTMLAYRPMQGTEHDARLARAYLERGTRERPEDSNVWMRYGQFIAFVAPSFLSNQSDKDAWRKDGAEALIHAVELGGAAGETLAATSMLTRAGATKEAIHYLEKAYAFTEHPAMHDVHVAIGRRLEALQSAALRDAADAAQRTIDERWAREMPAVSRDLYLLLGPEIDPARCAGARSARDAACARSWSDVTATHEAFADSP